MYRDGGGRVGAMSKSSFSQNMLNSWLMPAMPHCRLIIEIWGKAKVKLDSILIPWEQIDDLINAVTYVCEREDVDDNRIGMWGISYAGGHVFPAAALDPRIRIIMSVVPMLDGWYNTLRANSNVGLRELWDIVAKDRVERFKTGKAWNDCSFRSPPHEKASVWPGT